MAAMFQFRGRLSGLGVVDEQCCVPQTYLSAEVKEELAVPNLILKSLLKVDKSLKSETPIAMLGALLGT